MKRRASRPAPYEIPAKLNKRTTTTTVSRKLSTIRRTTTTLRDPMPPPKWPSIKNKSPSISRTSSLPKPDWSALVPASRSMKDTALSTSSEDMTEISEEPSAPVPGLRRMSTLPLEEEKEEMSRKGSKTLSKTGSKSLSKKGSSLTAVATLEKKGSVVTLDTSGTVTTVTRLASGSSVGETTSLSVAPPSIRKELSKATSSTSALSKAASTASVKSTLSKKVSSIRVTGMDAPEEPPASLSRGSSKASRAGSMRKETSLVPSASTSASTVPLPPGGLIEIVFSFDTTGSMSSCIDEVRGRVGDMIQRLQADIPGIRIAVIAHGDYCDEDTYVIKWINFGASLPELCDFVKNISGTGGGDFDECYELVLARAQTELSWTPGSQRSLVMIGDANPHPPSFYINRDEKLDWLEETKKLAAMDVKIYAVQAMNNSISTKFYQTLAETTSGRHLKLDQFNNIFDILMVLCYNERGSSFVQAYEDEVRTREGPGNLHKDLEGIFSAFRGGKISEGAKKVLAKGAAKGKKATPAKKKAPPPKGKAKVTGAKKPPKPGAALKGKSKTAAGKGKAKTTKGKAATKKASAHSAVKKAKGKGVKSVKGRKPTKATGKKTKKATRAKPKSKSKKPVPGVKHKFREAVKDEELNQGSCLKTVKWTKWFRAIIPKHLSRGRAASMFGRRMPPRKPWSKARRLPDRLGLRNMTILNDHNMVPALYEVAVQLKGKKRYVVFFKACSSWRRNVVWDTVLLNTASLHIEVNAVLEAGGEIWVRRGNVSTPANLTEATRHINKMYDYAWEIRKAGRGGDRRVRRVKKCNTLISGNSDS